MSLSYFFGGGVSIEPAGQDFYDASPAMRAWCDQVADWTGLPLSDLFTLKDEHDPGYRHIARIRQVVVALGVVDVLAEAGIRPATIGGGSTGGMVSSCVAGAVPRRALIDLLMRMREEPEPPDGREQAVAVLALSKDADLGWYFGRDRPDVYLSCDIGRTREGGMQLFMVSGHADELDRLAAEAGPGEVTVSRLFNALHSPLQQYFADYLEPYVRKIEFSDPRIPVYSSLERKTLTTAAEIEDMWVRNPAVPVHMHMLYEEMAANGTELAVVPGPSIPAGVLEFPFPVVNVQQPADVAKVKEAMYELDVRAPEADSIGGTPA
jgi:[acyl-carrier-protein] S-malonyltransferase